MMAVTIQHDWIHIKPLTHVVTTIPVTVTQIHSTLQCHMKTFSNVQTTVSWSCCDGEDSTPPPHRGGEIVRGLPCIKRLNQGGINKVLHFHDIARKNLLFIFSIL